ncbi:DUF2059 domain-containing protein [Rhodopseudomonas pseudopalustris]|uniref:DUF2059 domain-containing protein n=2 Tax=Rhodopseudomonas TaxID=1073 RepID=Q139E8_RHOPS|nr:DUF2059 domain-containing protein [Rhodopseudomonas pseudopalustris]ABE39291.1 conserved hypothetical protein [Rhodopseudomonas palustris BisB5]MBB1093192.1 DUF2059 domain-containing protein [Rhodopseudomonas palustris]SEO74756.1 hypothetical protein SAMN05444123_104333 [Rhodopseudomonas pseudopalustris]
MKLLSNALLATGLALGIALSAGHAMAQAKPPTPAAVAAAKEILELKRANTIYANAVPGIVQRTMDTLMQTNLNYQQDLKEVASVVAKNLAGREKEIGDGMAKIYAQDFTEQELKDLVAFYKTPLGQKLLNEEPKAIAASMQYMNQWAQTFSEEVNGQFRAEMRKRGKAI